MKAQAHAFNDAFEFRWLPGADRKRVALIRGDVASVPVANLKLRVARTPCGIWQEAALATHLAVLFTRPAHVFTPRGVTRRFAEKVRVDQRCVNPEDAAWPEQFRRHRKKPCEIIVLGEEWEEVSASDHEPRTVRK